MAPRTMTAAMRRLSRPIGGLVLAAVAAATVFLPLPYYSLGPGPAREMPPLIRFEERERYDPGGRIVMTTVRLRQLTLADAALAWLDTHRRIVHRDVVYPPGVPREEEERRSVSQMDESKIAATYVVLTRLTSYPRDHGAGALVAQTVPGCPADGELFPGDVIMSIDGRSIRSATQASRRIDAADPGSPITFDVEVDGGSERATFTREACGDGDDALVGVRLLGAFPFPIAMESGDVGGPSAGLMWALALWELLSPDDLTAGRTIAGTGQLGLDGTVYPIDGIASKVVAADRAGAAIFLAPAGNMENLRGVDTGDVQVVPVETFDDALEALGGASSDT
jgi:Lon-like protease